ncbi:MAG TPA: M20/M25/M40 family metallo-hydrolase [Chloroflexota bacterium]|nr:M20/M25/M40 family metallo-hydrolase [Chloroflexota bacterium]
MDRTLWKAVQGVLLALLLVVAGYAIQSPPQATETKSAGVATVTKAGAVSPGSSGTTPVATLIRSAAAAPTPGAVSSALPGSVGLSTPSLGTVAVPPTAAVSAVTPTISSVRVAPTGTPIAFSDAEALRQLRQLADEIGARPTDSVSQRQAAAMLKERFFTLGYSPTMQPYDFFTFQSRSSRLLLQKPETAEVIGTTFYFSGGGQVEGRLVACGLGRPSDFPRAGLAGQVALIARGGGISFESKVANAVSEGAAAAVIYNDRTGDFKGSLRQPAAIPVIGILQYDGERLLEYLKAGPTLVGLTVDAQSVTHSGENVIARLPARGNGKKVIVGAHYDSFSSVPGANDNGSGVATLLEVARAARGRAFPFDVEFVLFGDEEVGLVGSKKYVASLSKEQRSQLIAMVNLDMVGAGTRLEAGGDHALVGRVQQAGLRDDYQIAELPPGQNSTSDHASFLEAGIPAVMLHRGEDPNYHTSLDTSDRVLPANLDAAGTITLRLLGDFAKR